MVCGTVDGMADGMNGAVDGDVTIVDVAVVDVTVA